MSNPVSKSSLVGFHSSLSRHDHHNLELKTSLELSSDRVRSLTEMYLFVPKTMQFTSWTKSELMSDFRSRIRLSIPVHADGGDAALVEAERELETAFRQCLQDSPFDLNPLFAHHERLTEAAKHLGAVVNEALKIARHNLKKELLAGFSISRLQKNLERAELTLNRVRKLYAFSYDLPLPGVLVLLDEYLSHLYVQYLGGARKHLESLIATRENTPKIDEFTTLLDRLQTREAAYRETKNYEDVFDTRDDELCEVALYRLNHLKKYFQSKMFIDVSRYSIMKKLREPAAALAAAAAGTWAAVFQGFGSSSDITHYGLKGVMIMSLGVMGYVLKDRMKEKARTYLTEKASRILPDLEQRLGANDREIGKIQEWFSFRLKNQLPDDILKLRVRGEVSEIEGHIPEDIFYYRKTQEIESDLGKWAVQENMRLNLERHLKHLDDPYKMLNLLGANGRLRTTQSHRVYFLTVIVRQQIFADWNKKSTPVRTSDQLYRIVMDKIGIHRVQSLDYLSSKRTVTVADTSTLPASMVGGAASSEADRADIAAMGNGRGPDSPVDS